MVKAGGLRSGGLLNIDTPVLTVEDWEDGDMSEYGGNTGYFSVGTSPIWEGSYAVESSHSGGDYGIYSTSGLEIYPSEGDSRRVPRRVLFRRTVHVPRSERLSFNL
jgi:hypothetical protein